MDTHWREGVFALRRIRALAWRDIGALARWRLSALDLLRRGGVGKAARDWRAALIPPAAAAVQSRGSELWESADCFLPLFSFAKAIFDSHAFVVYSRFGGVSLA